MTIVVRLLVLILVSVSLSWSFLAIGSENPIITYWIEEEFEYIRDNVRTR